MKYFTLTRTSLYLFVIQLALLAVSFSGASGGASSVASFLPIVYVILSIIALFSKDKAKNPVFINVILIGAGLVTFIVFGWYTVLTVLFWIYKVIHG